jgi:hypothetical protein
VLIRIGRPETACGLPARIRLLPALMRISMKVVIRSIPIRYTVGQTVRIFPDTVRTFTKDTELAFKGLCDMLPQGIIFVEQGKPTHNLVKNPPVMKHEFS